MQERRYNLTAVSQYGLSHFEHTACDGRLLRLGVLKMSKLVLGCAILIGGMLLAGCYPQDVDTHDWLPKFPDTAKNPYRTAGDSDASHPKGTTGEYTLPGDSGMAQTQPVNQAEMDGRMPVSEPQAGTNDAYVNR